MNKDAEYAGTGAFRALAQLQDAQRDLAEVWLRGRDHTTGNIGGEVVRALRSARGAVAELEKIYAIKGRPASEIAGGEYGAGLWPDDPVSPEVFMRFLQAFADKGLTGRQLVALGHFIDVLGWDGGYAFQLIGGALSPFMGSAAGAYRFKSEAASPEPEPEPEGKTDAFNPDEPIPAEIFMQVIAPRFAKAGVTPRQVKAMEAIQAIVQLGGGSVFTALAKSLEDR